MTYQKRKNTIGIVLHHTVTAQNILDKDLRAIFKARFNVNYVGYNLWITGDGVVHSDIGDDAIGIHSNIGEFINNNSVGVSLAGNFEIEEPTIKQIDSLKKVIKDLVLKYPSMKNIVGHRDLKTTACPGRNLYKYLPELKTFINNKNDMNSRAFQQGTDVVLEVGGKTYPFDTPNDLDIFTEGKTNPSPTAAQIELPKEETRISFSKVINYNKDVNDAYNNGQKDKEALYFDALNEIKKLEEQLKIQPKEVIVEKIVEKLVEVKVLESELTAIDLFRLALRKFLNIK